MNKYIWFCWFVQVSLSTCVLRSVVAVLHGTQCCVAASHAILRCRISRNVALLHLAQCCAAASHAMLRSCISRNAALLHLTQCCAPTMTRNVALLQFLARNIVPKGFI